jgi:magnesium transporter
MIEIYRKSLKDEHIQKGSVVQKGSWVFVTEPTEHEMEFLTEDLKLERGHISDALDPFEVPRFELEGSVMYVFLRFPYEEHGAIQTMPILFIIGEDFIVTVARERKSVFEDFLSGKIDFTTTQKEKFLLLFFIKINLLYQSYLHAINKDIRVKQGNVAKITNQDIIAFVDRERVLNDFVTSLVPAGKIYKTLLGKQYLAFLKEDSDVVEDLMLSNEEAIDICNTSIKAISNVREAYSTILTNDLNKTMKFLAGITILLTLPTMIASVFGMNVRLPLQDHPLAFAGVMGLIAVVSLIAFWVFSKKEWF